MRNRIGRGIGIMAMVVFFLPLVIAGFGQLVHSLWNWLMPTLFRLPSITFWQSVGLMALCWILFGGLRGFGGHGWRSRGHWRHRMQERWEKMTPEEREKFREGMRGRCGGFSPDAAPKA